MSEAHRLLQLWWRCEQLVSSAGPGPLQKIRLVTVTRIQQGIRPPCIQHSLWRSLQVLLHGLQHPCIAHILHVML